MRLGIASGPCLHRMMPGLGVGQVNYYGLFRLFQQTGGGEWQGRPRMTTKLPPRCGGGGIRGEMTKAGFDVISISEDRGDVDVLTKILDDTDFSGVAQIVVLTGHGELLPRMCELARQGIEVFWLGVTSPLGYNRKGTCLSPEEVGRLLEQRVHYVELANHRDKIGREVVSRTAPSPEEGDPDKTTATLTLRSKSRRQHIEFFDRVRRLADEFPGLAISMK